MMSMNALQPVLSLNTVSVSTAKMCNSRQGYNAENNETKNTQTLLVLQTKKILSQSKMNLEKFIKN